MAWVGLSGYFDNTLQRFGHGDSQLENDVTCLSLGWGAKSSRQVWARVMFAAMDGMLRTCPTTNGILHLPMDGMLSICSNGW